MPISVTIVFTEQMEHVTVKEVVNGKIHIDDQPFAKNDDEDLTIDDSQGIGRVKISGYEVKGDGTRVPHNKQPELRSGQKYDFPRPKTTALAEIRSFPSLDALVSEIKSRL
ncbi:hypothetical protein ACDY97_26830 [Rhizobium mongolense]|uniref:hypothetical protein n=1 Tax=Rhizobium mongolense TaxID=57676 RepID=UPI0035560C18